MPPKVELGRKATYQDVLDAPVHLVAEIIGGDLYLSERPAPRTGFAMSRLGAGLGGAFARGRTGPDPIFLQDWWILREPELRLGGQILAPDLVGWRRERMERLHPLMGRRAGQWSVRVSGSWRIVFRFDSGEAVDVDFVDYH